MRKVHSGAVFYTDLNDEFESSVFHDIADENIFEEFSIIVTCFSVLTQYTYSVFGFVPGSKRSSFWVACRKKWISSSIRHCRHNCKMQGAFFVFSSSKGVNFGSFIAYGYNMVALFHPY